MVFLSLDQSLSCTGYTLWAKSPRKAEGTYKLVAFGTLSRPKYITDTVLQIKWMKEQVVQLMEEHKVTSVALEGLPYGMQSTSVRSLSALYFCLLLHFEKTETLVTVVTPTQAKKCAIKGNASKQEVYEALPQELREQVEQKGFKKTTGMYDIADAYWIAANALGLCEN